MKGLSSHLVYDSFTKGTGSSVIFSCPTNFNSQGYKSTYDGSVKPVLVSDAQTSRLNTDNNSILFVNPNPNYLYNFGINQSFIENEEIEFEIFYDITDVWINNDSENIHTYTPQTLSFETDKDSLESFNISFIIKDYEEDNEKVYTDKYLLNTLNKKLFKDTTI